MIFNKSKKERERDKSKMVVLETATMGSSLLGGPYAQGAPALKIIQKRYLGLHQWLSPVCASKDVKETIVSVTIKKYTIKQSKRLMSLKICSEFIQFTNKCTEKKEHKMSKLLCEEIYKNNSMKKSKNVLKKEIQFIYP